MSLKPKHVNFQETWNVLEETVKCVITLSNVPRATWNDRFSDVYSLCVAYPEPFTDKLYNETKKFLDNHVFQLLMLVCAQGESGWLQAYHRAWTEYSQGINYLHCLYLYLNQQHIQKQKVSDAELIYGTFSTMTDDCQEQMEIGELGLDIWKKRMIIPLKKQLVSQLLESIHADRVGKAEIASTEVVCGVIQSFVSVGKYKLLGDLDEYFVKNVMHGSYNYLLILEVHIFSNLQEFCYTKISNNEGITAILAEAVFIMALRGEHNFFEPDHLEPEDSMYQEIFETPFLEASGEFYMKQAVELRLKSDITHYMEKVTSQLVQEELRAHKFLHSSSVPKVRQCCEEKMIATHVAWLHTEAEIMIENEHRRNLSLLYPLLMPIPSGLAPLVQKLTQHITQQGMQAIGSLQGDNVHTQFVESMLDVHHKYSELIKDVFKNDQAFVTALDKACSAVVNHKPVPRQPARAPELLAKYCDSLLKRYAKAASEAEVEEKLGRCITVFKYVDDKDVFQKFYARMLAKRLIHQQSQSQSMDAEELMIDRLKQACGYEFTNKLHRMFTDMSVSTDLNAKFATSLREGGRENQLGIGFVVYVLQAGAWPLGLPSSSGPFHIPQQLEKSIQAFETFYHAQFSGRKLTWLHHLCQGELKFNYLKKPYLVTVQTYQMALLLLFEHCNSIQCREAAASLRLSHEQLVKHATSLVDCKVLKKSTEGELKEDTTLSLNFNYSNKRTKFRIPGALQRDMPHENHDTEATHRSVADDRKLYLQAAIVRIMKSRKVLRHNQLVQEVLSQSKFTFAPSIGMIKKCIESLIDKQYIERAPNNADEYSYVA